MFLELSKSKPAPSLFNPITVWPEPFTITSLVWLLIAVVKSLSVILSFSPLIDIELSQLSNIVPVLPMIVDWFEPEITLELPPNICAFWAWSSTEWPSPKIVTLVVFSPTKFWLPTINDVSVPAFTWLPLPKALTLEAPISTWFVPNTAWSNWFVLSISTW